jgi:hypothetical protein
MVGNTASGNAIIKYNPTEIGLSPVNANDSNDPYEFQWSIYWIGPKSCN